VVVDNNAKFVNIQVNQKSLLDNFCHFAGCSVIKYYISTCTICAGVYTVWVTSNLYASSSRLIFPRWRSLTFTIFILSIQLLSKRGWRIETASVWRNHYSYHIFAWRRKQNQLTKESCLFVKREMMENFQFYVSLVIIGLILVYWIKNYYRISENHSLFS
jgi:nicotinamide riboside transporter PnuC